MRKREHRLNVSEVSLVVCHFKLVGSVLTRVCNAMEEINQLYGVDDVSFDNKSAVLNIAYDASRVCLECIEEVLTKNGLVVGHDWCSRFKENYYRFVDQNVKDNAKQNP